MLAQKLSPVEAEYEFTNDWFAPQVGTWRDMFGQLQPKRLLEIGCYEGRSTTFMIETAAEYCDPDITCVDTWAGAIDLPPQAMRGVEARFDSNIAIAIARAAGRANLEKLKQPSLVALARMVVAPIHPFDFIYIDGSHTAPDVLTDAVLAFQLLRLGGVMVFDDYAWRMEPPGYEDLLNMPKFAIDTFVNTFQRKLTFTPFGAGHAQFLIQKTAV